MSGYLLDTNLLSEFSKPLPNSVAVQWTRNQNPDLLFASVITYGEIRLGIEKLPLGKRRTELEFWLETGLKIWFSSDLLPVTRDIVERWASLTVKAKQQGMTIATQDGLIAATALHHGLTLVTRNTRDFANLGLTLFNPWQPLP